MQDLPYLADRIDDLIDYHGNNSYLNKIELNAVLRQLAPKLVPFLFPTWNILDNARKKGKRILFEGAQGVMLDNSYGTYPYVTSSNTVAGEAASGSGISPKMIHNVLGITKAYTTRVGSGPFPTELDDDLGHMLGARGNEFGTVTGRKRRCGWFDAVMVKQACVIGGIDGIALTKIDILDDFHELKVCTRYMLDNELIDYFPSSTSLQARLVPVYETIPGWSDSTKGTRKWRDLPANTIKYIRRIEELIDRPVTLLSTSPERDDTIVVKDPFID